MARCASTFIANPYLVDTQNRSRHRAAVAKAEEKGKAKARKAAGEAVRTKTNRDRWDDLNASPNGNYSKEPSALDADNLDTGLEVARTPQINMHFPEALETQATSHSFALVSVRPPVNYGNCRC